MVYKIADNVLSPLGATTAENYLAMKDGCSSLKHYASFSGREEDNFVASRFSDEQRKQLMVSGLTWFESLVYQSIKQALSECPSGVITDRTQLILSTTKGNIDHLASSDYENLLPAESALRIARLIGITMQPLVVSDACISGVAAIITAQRLLDLQCCDVAIVTGCDIISHFVVSGFQSLKALSPKPCRPFDIERIGLNLGEAAATMILSNKDTQGIQWQIVNGALRNDAYHISSPSPKGEGCCSAIQEVIKDIEVESIAAVNVHGTATMYNDQMESKAIESAGLSHIPINTLKGYLGHTLGASGILETIITMQSIEHGELLATKGFNDIGVSGRVSISSQSVPVSGHSFVKIISGFGGNNAAIYCKYGNPVARQSELVNYEVLHRVQVTPQEVRIDGSISNITPPISDIYKRYIGSYPKFYKMDRLSQLGFVTSELLLNLEQPRKRACDDRAIVLFNHTSSGWVDKEYAQTIRHRDSYFPSPSLFVYTLPNIVCGEVALRHGYHAETSFYMMDSKNEAMMDDILQSTFLDHTIHSIIAGWIDYQDEQTFEADFKLLSRI